MYTWAWLPIRSWSFMHKNEFNYTLAMHAFFRKLTNNRNKRHPKHYFIGMSNSPELEPGLRISGSPGQQFGRVGSRSRVRCGVWPENNCIHALCVIFWPEINNAKCVNASKCMFSSWSCWNFVVLIPCWIKLGYNVWNSWEITPS